MSNLAQGGAGGVWHVVSKLSYSGTQYSLEVESDGTVVGCRLLEAGWYSWTIPMRQVSVCLSPTYYGSSVPS